MRPRPCAPPGTSTTLPATSNRFSNMAFFPSSDKTDRQVVERAQHIQGPVLPCAGDFDALETLEHRAQQAFGLEPRDRLSEAMVRAHPEPGMRRAAAPWVEQL